jgi:hypothetical protein
LQILVSVLAGEDSQWFMFICNLQLLSV